MNTMISRNGTNALIARASFQLMVTDITNAATVLSNCWKRCRHGSAQLSMVQI